MTETYLTFNIYVGYVSDQVQTYILSCQYPRIRLGDVSADIERWFVPDMMKDHLWSPHGVWGDRSSIISGTENHLSCNIYVDFESYQLQSYISSCQYDWSSRDLFATQLATYGLRRIHSSKIIQFRPHFILNLHEQHALHENILQIMSEW